MKQHFYSLYNFFKNIPYVFLNKYTKKQTREIFRKYLILQCFSIIIKPPFSFSKFKINWFSTKFIRGLFDEIFTKGIYKFETKNPNPIVFDLGANIWIATLYFKYLYPHSQVYSFEPDDKTFLYLESNIAINKLSNVSIYKQAVSDYDGEIEFYSDDVPWYSMSVVSERGNWKKCTKPCISLSNFIQKSLPNKEKIDFLKMDIEWAEDEVITDLDKHNSLSRIQEMVIEYHHNIPWKPSKFEKILAILVKQWFTYEIDALIRPYNSADKFQDILIRAYKK